MKKLAVVLAILLAFSFTAPLADYSRVYADEHPAPQKPKPDEGEGEGGSE